MPPFNLKGLLQDEEFLFAAGLLQQGSQGKSLGAAAFPALVQAGKIKKSFAPKDKERRIVKGNDGFQYYADTGERVLPNVEKQIKPTDRRIIKGADGYNYFSDNMERVLPNVEKQIKPTKRNIIKDAAGFQRYADTGERVFPGVEKPNKSKSVKPLTDNQKLELDLNKNDNVTGTFDAAGNLIDYKVSSKIDDRMGKISKAVKDSGLQESDEALRSLENYIVDLKGQGYENLPGIGLVQGRTPGAAISAEGKKLRSLVSAYENITLKKRSGAAVTPSELLRVQAELAGAIKTSDENVLLDVIRRNRNVLEKQKKTVFAAYRPDDVSIYQDKGGLSYFKSPLDFNIGNQPIRTGLEDLSLEELEELLKKTK